MVTNVTLRAFDVLGFISFAPGVSEGVVNAFSTSIGVPGWRDLAEFHGTNEQMPNLALCRLCESELITAHRNASETRFIHSSERIWV